MLMISVPTEQAAQLEALSYDNAMEGSEFIILALENMLDYLEAQGVVHCPPPAPEPPAAFTYGEPEEPVLMAADIDGEPTDC